MIFTRHDHASPGWCRVFCFTGYDRDTASAAAEEDPVSRVEKAVDAVVDATDVSAGAARGFPSTVSRGAPL